MGELTLNDFRQSGSSLCWLCANSVPVNGKGCSWSKRLEPVNGWKLAKDSAGRGSMTVVDECPEFVEDVPGWQDYIPVSRIDEFSKVSHTTFVHRAHQAGLRGRIIGEVMAYKKDDVKYLTENWEEIKEELRAKREDANHPEITMTAECAVDLQKRLNAMILPKDTRTVIAKDVIKLLYECAESVPVPPEKLHGTIIRVNAIKANKENRSSGRADIIVSFKNKNGVWRLQKIERMKSKDVVTAHPSATAKAEIDKVFSKWMKGEAS